MSNKTKHTPGPWRVIDQHRVYSALGADSGDGAKADSNDGWCICVCSGDDVPLTSYGGVDTELGWGVIKANARLIAEAGTVATETGLTPRQLAGQRADLLESLKGMLAESDAWGLYGDNSETNSRIDAARAALAKAQGEF